MKPQQVVQWEWEVVRGEVEFTLLRPTGSVSSVEGAGVEGEQVEGYEQLLEPESGKLGEVKQVGGLFSCTVSSRVHTTMNTCLHLQGSYECVGTELLALHWAASPPTSTATIMFSYEIMGTQQHRYTMLTFHSSSVAMTLSLSAGTVCLIWRCARGRCLVQQMKLEHYDDNLYAYSLK